MKNGISRLPRRAHVWACIGVHVLPVLALAWQSEPMTTDWQIRPSIVANFPNSAKWAAGRQYRMLEGVWGTNYYPAAYERNVQSWSSPLDSTGHVKSASVLVNLHPDWVMPSNYSHASHVGWVDSLPVWFSFPYGTLYSANRMGILYLSIPTNGTFYVVRPEPSEFEDFGSWNESYPFGQGPPTNYRVNVFGNVSTFTNNGWNRYQLVFGSDFSEPLYFSDVYVFVECTWIYSKTNTFFPNLENVEVKRTNYYFLSEGDASFTPHFNSRLTNGLPFVQYVPPYATPTNYPD